MSQVEILLWVHSISLTKCWDTAILWAPPICHFVSDHKIQWICSIFHSISHISMFCICEHHWFDTFGGAHLKAAMDLCNLPMDLTNPICDQESFHISQVIVSASTEYFNSISIGYRAWALCFHYKFFNHKEFFPILTSCCATGYASSSSRAPSRQCCTSFTPLPVLFLTIFLSSFCSRDSLLIFLLWKFLCTVQVAKGWARRCSCARRAWS